MWAQAVGHSMKERREKGWAALGGTTPALELGSTDGELCSNDKAELFQRYRKCKALGPDLHRAG